MSQLNTYIVYLDDAIYAQAQLATLLAAPQIKRFVLVACAPRMTRRIGKWLSHSSRENWRDKWCDKLFSQFTRMIRREDHVFCEVATGPLPEFTDMLLKDVGQAQVLDARRPKFGVDMPPLVEAPAASAAPAEPAVRASVQATRPIATTTVFNMPPAGGLLLRPL